MFSANLNTDNQLIIYSQITVRLTRWNQISANVFALVNLYKKRTTKLKMSHLRILLLNLLHFNIFFWVRAFFDLKKNV